MRTCIHHAAILCAIAAMCQASIASAEDLQWMFTGGEACNGQAANDQSPCDLASKDCHGSWLGAYDCEPVFGIVGLFGLDAFKGYADLDYPSNFGTVLGFNSAAPLPGLGQYGFGWQFGLTYGVYDWDGREVANSAESQQQTFVTTGFYRKAREGQRLSFGVVYDWMYNRNWGYRAISPTLGQWRGQIEYALNDRNGLGVYGCAGDLTSVDQDPFGSTYKTIAVNQANFFWHHKFESAADSWLYIGLPEHARRLNGDGTLGDWIIGASVQVPLSERFALYGNAQYMHPTAAAGDHASVDAAWNIGGGICWYFGGHAVSHSLNGKSWMPYMPVANNGTFLTDVGP